MRSFGRCDYFGILDAIDEGISAVTSWTATDGIMIDHLALTIGSTGSRAWVNTLLLDTGLAELTVRTEEALRTAVRRTSKVTLEARTDSSISIYTALAVRAAWISLTRILGLLWCNWFLCKSNC